jgi:hypothetical protein
MPVIKDITRKIAYSPRLKDKKVTTKEEKPGLTPEQLKEAEKALRDAIRWIGNFHTFIFGYSDEQKPQIQAWIKELQEQVSKCNRQD